MEIISSIIQIIPSLCTQISNATNYLRDLPKNVDTLSQEAEFLQGKCDDIETEVKQRAGRQGNQLKQQVKVWLRLARKMIDETNSIKSEFDKRQTLSLLSRYRLGRKAAKQLEAVKIIIERGHFEQEDYFFSSPMAISAAPGQEGDEEDARTIPAAPSQASFNRTMKEVLDHLHNERSSIICVYGMGGIGKTRLMTAIEKELKRTPKKFKVIIRVTLSKNFNNESLQMEIMKSLDLGLLFQDNFKSQSKHLSRIMSRSRYVLMVDDLWQKIDLDDLENVGIPPPCKNNSKIVITTRLVDVCNDMLADAKIRMQTLTKEEAWELFVANVGEVEWEPYIQAIAANIVEECGGLPLAIITVAKAMREKTQKELWENTATLLKASTAHEIRGMETQVFERLKPSYDELKDHKVKMCFLYCSLFPKGYEICVNDLVNIWTIEGYIDKVHNLVEGSDKGQEIVDRLKDKCLLEGGISHPNNVKMHHVIRNFAVWITSLPPHKGGPESKFLIKAGKPLIEPPLDEETEHIEKISLMKSAINELPPAGPTCCSLVSLFLRNNPITVVPCSFFERMPRLKILDLSATDIESLTLSSSSLRNLRALILKECKKLRDLRFLGQLEDLQILDLSYSSITLPCEMQKLHRLKKLDLSYIDEGLTIPPNSIYGLSSMVDLRLMMTKVKWAKQSDHEVMNLKYLISLELYIHDVNCVEEYVPHWPWSKLERFKIRIGQVLLYKDLPCARQMQIDGGGNYPHEVKVIVAHTQGLMLHSVDGELVSHLFGDVKSLESLKILFFHSCSEMQFIVDCRHVGENALGNIEHLNLYFLPKLKKLFEQVSKGCLKKLRRIEVQYCNALKSLFSSEMLEDLRGLEYLDVRNCDELEEIIEGEITQGGSKTKKESAKDESRAKKKTVEGELPIQKRSEEELPSKKEESTKGDLKDERSTEGDSSAKNSQTVVPLENLRSLELSQLTKLRSIIRLRTLALGNLKYYHEFKCPNLRVPDCPNIMKLRPTPQT